MWAQSSRWLLVNGCASAVSCWRGRRLRPQFGDQPQNLLEHLPGNGDLGHLKSDITAVAHDLRANLDQPFLESRQRPVFDRLRRRQRAQEIPEIVSQRMKLEANSVGGEGTARQPRPLDRALALFDPLLTGTSLNISPN